MNRVHTLVRDIDGAAVAMASRLKYNLHFGHIFHHMDDCGLLLKHVQHFRSFLGTCSHKELAV